MFLLAQASNQADAVRNNPAAGAGGLLHWLITAVCLFFIAGKLGDGDSWMSFVPIVQWFYLYKLSGKNMALLIILTVLCCTIPIAWGIAWGGIAERQGKPAILGWLCAIPGLNLILMPIIAFT